MHRMSGLRFAAKIVAVVAIFGLAGALMARSDRDSGGHAAMTVVDGSRATTTSTTGSGESRSDRDLGPTSTEAASSAHGTLVDGSPTMSDGTDPTQSSTSPVTTTRPRSVSTVTAAPTGTAPPTTSPSTTSATATTTTPTTTANRGPTISNASTDRTQIYEACAGSSLPTTASVQAYVSDPDGVASVRLTASGVGTSTTMQPSEPDPRATLGPYPSGTAPAGGSVTMSLTIRATDTRGASSSLTVGTVTLYAVAC